MSAYKERRQSAIEACRVAFEAERDGVLTPSIEARRVAALRHLHALEDPWGPCPCEICSGATW